LRPKSRRGALICYGRMVKGIVGGIFWLERG
jgi:hypothetical protein